MHFPSNMVSSRDQYLTARPNICSLLKDFKIIDLLRKSRDISLTLRHHLGSKGDHCEKVLHWSPRTEFYLPFAGAEASEMVYFHHDFKNPFFLLRNIFDIGRMRAGICRHVKQHHKHHGVDAIRKRAVSRNRYRNSRMGSLSKLGTVRVLRGDGMEMIVALIPSDTAAEVKQIIAPCIRIRTEIQLFLLEKSTPFSSSSATTSLRAPNLKTRNQSMQQEADRKAKDT